MEYCGTTHSWIIETCKRNVVRCYSKRNSEGPMGRDSLESDKTVRTGISLPAILPEESTQPNGATPLLSISSSCRATVDMTIAMVTGPWANSWFHLQTRWRWLHHPICGANVAALIAILLWLGHFATCPLVFLHMSLVICIQGKSFLREALLLRLLDLNWVFKVDNTRGFHDFMGLVISSNA